MLLSLVQVTNLSLIIEVPKKEFLNVMMMTGPLAERLLRTILIKFGKDIKLFITGIFAQVCCGSQTKWKCDIRSWSKRV